MSIPTRGETYAKLMEHLRYAQEDAAMMAHLLNTESGPMDTLLAKGWLGISELLKMMQHKVTALAQGNLQ
jgi:hypothetical protein